MISVFDNLFRTQSVGETAIRLGTTQSAISRSLGRLRLHFDDRLFVKTNNRMLPTAKAQHLAPTIGQVMSLIRDTLLQEVNFDPRHASRSITIGVADVGEMVLLPELYKLLQAEAPNCELRTVSLDVDRLRPAMETGAVDLVIHSSPPRSKEIMQQALFSEPFAIVAHPNAPLKGSVSAKQYASMDHATFLPADSTEILDSYLAQHGISRRVRIRTPHLIAVLELVSQSPSLIATVPASLAAVYRKRGLIKALTPDFPLPVLNVHQYWHRRFDKEPFNVWLRAAMRRTVARVRSYKHGDRRPIG
ncbi:LysR family transcriptional regulator [Bradyrhizobium diazoefficiens]|uniref:LysR family transcriptional regulator n=1 Tax=Bradyrhizobium diazoefficiens TaxID=1355477 RepID=UPI001B8D5600|nr:LysR family transcriptional regulator [Bradyrhizobium diazoefficiens]MBR0863499.1 LysR family transcriptional regulator [Bradyrhizobium diazoefficiens]MBR0888184.1 LysR family transcriptional regulator [Bradyrhizobium diazoefficiens]MBR0919825.1 LysR family transcriptional regulator [Bradyrhizobium diazoefficiens]